MAGNPLLLLLSSSLLSLEYLPPYSSLYRRKMATINHSRNSSSLSSTAPFIVAFFGAMVLHEIALEGITAVYGLPNLRLSSELFLVMVSTNCFT
jgi:hypothetical protein